MSAVTEVPDSNALFTDTEFISNNSDVSEQWVSIRELYPQGANEPLLPDTFSREQFGQGNHYECFMMSALATLVRFPDVIRNCIVTKKVRRDGRYTFKFFRSNEWVKVEIDDTIALEDDDVLYVRSPTEHWWPLLLEKAYAKFYNGYNQLDGCTLLEVFHDLTGHPVLNIPMQEKLAKSAGVNIGDGTYWLSMGDSLRKGVYVASALTKEAGLEDIGMQSEQQYAILTIFSLTGSSSLNDVVVHLHNPFEDEECDYTGPLNRNDSAWTEKHRRQYPIDDRHSIFMPMKNFIKLTNSIQFCYMSNLGNDIQVLKSEWKGRSAGGNPTFVTWRMNPLFLARNDGDSEARLVTMITQEDQRRTADPDEGPRYVQCGLVVSRSTYPNPIPTFYVTGNNHRTIFKSLFLNSREVASEIVIPAHSTCYIVPCAMNKSAEARFQLSFYRFQGESYDDFSIEPLSVPGVNWIDPATLDVELRQKEKDRVDFYVDEATDIHILMHQTKPYVSKSGGDAMTEDYMGMYLYDDTDRRVGGVHAATNFREISIIHKLPRSGRYAVSVTCPRAKAEVPAYVTICGSPNANARIVDAPEDATMFDDEDIIDEGEDDEDQVNPIDYIPIHLNPSSVQEIGDADAPFEDKRFYVDNRNATPDPWVHIGDLYPEGKSKPLLPDTLRCGQFEQGDHSETCCLTGFAALVENHPDVIRNCFITKNPRKDGRYTFQFHRYGQWIKVEIDDRIPQVNGNTLYCRSPTQSWWPLLLEKAYAKFYTLYQNLEGLTQEEFFHDFTGNPIVSTTTNVPVARSQLSYIDEGYFWTELRDSLPRCSVTARSNGPSAQQFGLVEDYYYAVLDIYDCGNAEKLSDIVVKMYNPFEESLYCGPLNLDDKAWTPQMISAVQRSDDRHAFYIPAKSLLSAFDGIQQGYVSGLSVPGWNFNSEWSKGTNGGNRTLVSWRENPLYVVRNVSDDPVQIVAMARLPDQRHLLHTLANGELAYPKHGITVAKANPESADIETYLVTLDNHKLIHHGPLERTREVTNVVCIPPNSLSYVVSNCMFRDLSKFILSYWFLQPKDESKLQVHRYKPAVAVKTPAIAQVDLYNRAKERVDFLVDVPTDVHILLRQQKPFQTPEGGDVQAEDYVGLYLYDSNDRRVKGVNTATNYRESSLVAHLASPGQYTVFCTCPRGADDVPCRVEIVAVEDAHVRIAEATADAENLNEVDLAFLDPTPYGVPLCDLPLATDQVFQRDLTQLRSLQQDPYASPEELQDLRDRMNDRCYALAREKIGADRPLYLPNHDLDMLRDVLDADDPYMVMEAARYDLKQDPRNSRQIAACEKKLQEMADKLAETQLDSSPDFLGDSVEGIPVEDLELPADDEFSAMMKARASHLRDPAKNASSIAAVEEKLCERAHAIAAAMHANERSFLDPTPESVPLELLPLNDSNSFCAMENELRALRRENPHATDRISDLEEKLNNKAHAMARALKDGERRTFLPPGSEDIAAVLDTDSQFTRAEVERLRLKKEDPHGNAQQIRALEERLQQRAKELGDAVKADERAFLRRYGVDPAGIKALLDEDAEFASKEEKLRQLRKDPNANADAIRALEDQMARRAEELAKQYAAGERPGYLQATYEGRPTATLPLDDDAAFRELEKAYLAKRDDGSANPKDLKQLEAQMGDRAREIAKALNAADRAKYLPKAVRGVPVGVLPLDEDDVFHQGEVQRAAVVTNPRSNPADVTAAEKALLDRAEELAQQRLTGDRGFLHPKPGGIPVELLPIDNHNGFRQKEEERAMLLASSSPQKSREPVSALEDGMNADALALATTAKKAQIKECVPSSPRGIPVEQLKLESDEEAVGLMAERIGTQKAMESARLAKALNDRATKVADDLIRTIRSRLDASPMGVPLEELPLDTDPAYKESELAAVAALQDPKSSPAVLERLIADMNERTKQLAEAECWRSREAFMDPTPEGRALHLLPLNTDDAFLGLETERRKLMRNDAGQKEKMKGLESKMNERATQLARAMNVADRPTYLPKKVRGVALEKLPLNGDEEFHTLECARALALNDPKKSSNLNELEAALLARAEQLAATALKNDRQFLDAEPEGVPLRQVPLDGDEQFCRLEEDRAALKTNASPSSSDKEKLDDLESRMNDRAHELAKQVKAKLRTQLNQMVDGIPLADLPLDEDNPFTSLEVECRDASSLQDNGAECAALKEKLNERAEKIAADVHAKERAGVAKLADGMPVSVLPLSTDKSFAALESEARAQRKGAAGNRNRSASSAAEVARLNDGMNQRARELALEARKCYCDPEPEGIPLDLIAFADQPAFLEKEKELRGLQETQGGSSTPVKKCKEELNKMAHDIAKQMVSGDRGYLESHPQGVSLSVLPLDTDSKFHELEVERAKLLAASGPSPVRDGKVKALEKHLNDRANELAVEQKKEDLRGLNEAPRGIPLSVLQPHNDAAFSKMVDELRELKKNPTRDGSEIKKLQAAMDERCLAMANGRVQNDRAYLDPAPEGYPVELLPLDADPTFAALEAKRANLKALNAAQNAPAIADLEKKLNERAHELAKEAIARELAGLDAEPFGIPLEILKPYSDGAFANEIQKLRQLPTADAKDPRVAPLKAAMNERCSDLAHKLLEGDRKYLDPEIKGVPLSLLPLNADPTFHAAEVQRAVLKAENAQRNAAKVSELENVLVARADELADARRLKDLDGVDKNPLGVSLAALDPHGDPIFAKLVKERRALNPTGDGKLSPAEGGVVKAMNDRAAELAKASMEGDRAYLDRKPEGVPLEVLPLQTDQQFHDLEAERANLKAKNPKANAERIAALEAKLNSRAHELALNQKKEDLRGVEASPRGVPLQLLHPHEDVAFAALIEKARELKARGARDVSAPPLEGIIAEMNRRADELAVSALDHGYLTPDPLGVPLSNLPLDTDAKFKEMELERAYLRLSEPKGSDAAVRAMEDRLNARALELAKRQRVADLEGVDSAPAGVPKELLGLHEDTEVCAPLIDKLRALKKDPSMNAEQIKKLEAQMNERAHALADSLVRGSRPSYVEDRPRNIPREDLPLDSDEKFHELEVERAKMIATDPKQNAKAIQATEELLGDRAYQLAAYVMEEDLKPFPTSYGGILTRDLKPHSDKLFCEAAERNRRRKRDPKVTFADDLEKVMWDRLEQLAHEAKDGELYFLDPNPEGVPLADIPLSSDEAFNAMKAKRAALKQAADPLANRAEVESLEARMNERAHAMALDILDQDFDGVDAKPLGVPRDLLKPRENPVVARIIPELRRAKRSSQLGKKVKELQSQLNDEVLAMADAALLEGQENFLDPTPESVPLSILPLRDDEVFHAKEVERTVLRLSDASHQPPRAAALEKEMNARAHELAKQQKAEDLKGVDRAPRGIALEVLQPHEDDKMAGMIKDARTLKKDPTKNAEKLASLQGRMNDRAYEMAAALLEGDRGYLHPNPLGVPLSVLPLNTDGDFVAAEVERATLKKSMESQPSSASSANKQKITDLEKKLNERAKDLAAEQLEKDLEGLDPAPLGVPLALLNPHGDEKFASMLPELRRLASKASQNAPRLQSLRADMGDCTEELAEKFLDKDRASYLDAEPAGIPFKLLPLSTDAEFKELERKKLALQAAARGEKPSKSAADAIRQLEAQLNERAHDIAAAKLRTDRDYLDPYPKGVPLQVLPLDTDPTFHQLEATRAAAKGRNATAQVAELERQLNDRAKDLAEAQKEEDLRGLEPAPRGVRLGLLQPHEDGLFAELVDDLRSLKASDKASSEAIATVQGRMNERAMELAEAVTKKDRGYLHPNPEGIPLARIPLDDDKKFAALEAQRATLKLQDPKRNANRIGDLEDQLNEQARALAAAVKARDLVGLDQAPRGIPIELLNPHQDTKFAALAEERDRMPKTRGAAGDEKPLVGSLNSCAEEMADKLLRGDRGYLDREPEGVPLAQLPLDTDPVFHQMEVERAVLKAKDPKANQGLISDLEEQLNRRAHELAMGALARDRSYLNPLPEGVPIVELPLDTDSRFHQMEVERAKLKGSKAPSALERVHDLEARLNDRAEELARAQLEEDLQGLDKEPWGYPIALLHPHRDGVFAGVVPALRAAKRKAKDGNSTAERDLAPLRAQLNDRCKELAKEQIARDRAFLDQEPRGVPLALLSLEADPQFKAAEKELRGLTAADGKQKKNPALLAEAQGNMQRAANKLAEDYVQRSRAAILDPEPEGVPLAELPLDKDAEFKAKEKERLRLLASGVEPSSKQAQKLAAEMNERAHALARKEKADYRAFLRDKSHGIPKELLALDGDKDFAKMEKALRDEAHGKSGDGPARQSVAGLQNGMQLRADEIAEAMLKGDRDQILDSEPEGVELCDLPLDTDETFGALELERAILLAKDPVNNAGEAKAIAGRMNDRAHELAKALIAGDRAYLPDKIHEIPVEELPLDDDAKFKKLEKQRRAHKRVPTQKKEVLADEEELCKRARELAEEIMAEDLRDLKPVYRGIPKEELNLHADAEFRELAKRRRKQRGRGRVDAVDAVDIDDAMDRRACEIADDVIDNERAFLDPEPEGMYLRDVPLDDDAAFTQLEQEYRRRSRDPRAAKQNKDILRELANEMNQRSHALARMEFAKRRAFMNPEPEGIPLSELGLDEDPEFKEAEIARYRNDRCEKPSERIATDTGNRMEVRAEELARALLAADRAFLDQEPEGVPLGELPLDSDREFGDLARERRRRKKALKLGMGEGEVRSVEDQMNDRTHAMAKEFLANERAFLPREPEGVPLEDLPLNSDTRFRAAEKERLALKKEPISNAPAIAAKEAELSDEAKRIARRLLKKERAFLDPEPFGVPLEELPLNFDPELNGVERRRRQLRKDAKNNHEPIRSLEEQMATRINAIAEDYVAKERAFLDQMPEGVPLRYLPLNTDREFREMELQRRGLLKKPDGNREAIQSIEKKMNNRVHALARELVEKGRGFLNPEPLGVPIADVPLNGDESFRKMEEQRRALKESDRSQASVKTLEDRLNQRAEELAEDLLAEERAFMDPAPLGLTHADLPLNTDWRMREIERTRRHLRKEDPNHHADDIAVLESGMEGRARELAEQVFANDRAFLHPEPCGVPLRDLPLNEDLVFHTAELERFHKKKRLGGAKNVPDKELAPLEDKLNARAFELAEAFIRKERAYLDQEPEGIPLEKLPLDTDSKFHAMELERRQLRRAGTNPSRVADLEDRLNARAHELALEMRGWQDAEFHAANKHVAEKWVRIGELFPEGKMKPVEPQKTSCRDVFSAPQDAGYMAPFVAALGRHPVLLQRLVATKEHPFNAPYTFVFFDPSSNPVYVDIDDRIPCTLESVPKFTQSSDGLWYPLLLEKAYAKFVGGYEQLNNCTPHETLRDLTGRPVTHVPFDHKIAEAANIGNFESVNFWRGVSDDLQRGDLVLTIAKEQSPDGLHPFCSYALVDVIETYTGTDSPADMVVVLHDAYYTDAPRYKGPLAHGDSAWDGELAAVCNYEDFRKDLIYMPLPVFLRNFSSLQTCHINCGDRLTAIGTWDRRTSGGNPKFTSFRNNPIYLVENKGSRAAVVLAEVRHSAPLFVDPDGLNHYPQTGVALLQSMMTATPHTPLITNNSHRFLQKGMMLDSREVCSLMEIPANTSCYIVPYTLKQGQYGSFNVSVYPGMAKVTLTPLHYCGLSREPTSTKVTLYPGEEGRRVDFSLSRPCEVHVLLHQLKVTDAQESRKGDAIAEDDVVIAAFDDQAVRLASSGDATNAREHCLAFAAEKSGRYSLLLSSPNQPVSGDCPCMLEVYTPKGVTVKYVAAPAGARPLQQVRLPTLPKKEKRGTTARQSIRRSVSSRGPNRGDSLPPIRSSSSRPTPLPPASQSSPSAYRY